MVTGLAEKKFGLSQARHTECKMEDDAAQQKIGPFDVVCSQ
jgi:hypothetical protein